MLTSLWKIERTWSQREQIAVVQPRSRQCDEKTTTTTKTTTATKNYWFYWWDNGELLCVYLLWCAHRTVVMCIAEQQRNWRWCGIWKHENVMHTHIAHALSTSDYSVSIITHFIYYNVLLQYTMHIHVLCCSTTRTRSRSRTNVRGSIEFAFSQYAFNLWLTYDMAHWSERKCLIWRPKIRPQIGASEHGIDRMP